LAGTPPPGRQATEALGRRTTDHGGRSGVARDPFRARWLRFLPRHLPGAFPYLPGQSGYNKRLNAAVPLLKQAVRLVAADTDLWFDDVWVTDSTPIECGRSRPTAKRSELAGWAGYGYCASHSRFF
jgi:hypothetical protein